MMTVKVEVMRRFTRPEIIFRLKFFVIADWFESPIIHTSVETSSDHKILKRTSEKSQRISKHLKDHPDMSNMPICELRKNVNNNELNKIVKLFFFL